MIKSGLNVFLFVTAVVLMLSLGHNHRPQKELSVNDFKLKALQKEAFNQCLDKSSNLTIAYTNAAEIIDNCRIYSARLY